MKRCIRLLAAAACCAVAAVSHATTIELPTATGQAGYGEWAAFNVSEIESVSFGTEWIDSANTLDPGYGTPLVFHFTIAQGMSGQLSVVDAGFAGDSYTLTNHGAAWGATSAVPATTDASAAYVGNDFDAAWSNSAFSRATLTLAPGEYSLSGALAQSVTGDFDGLPLNASVGAVRLAVSPVPEPSSVAMLLAGIAALALVARRRG